MEEDRQELRFAGPGGDKAGADPLRIRFAAKGFEGAAENGWMLLDCGDVIVHVFGPLERDFYRLERLWSAAPTVVYLQ